MTTEKRILLVDDEQEIINFMERFLKRLKISSTKVTSGEAALRVYDKDLFNCVFLDIHLEGIDGFTVLRELKKADPDANVILITGSTDKASYDKARELGAIDYISKPIELGELKEKIDRYLG